MDNNKRYIIWLEDHLDLNKDADRIIKNTNFTLIVCKNLSSFGEEMKRYSTVPYQIAGFVLDNLLRADSLKELGMPNIRPSGGVDTGFCVLLYYLRNNEGDSPLGNSFK